MLPTMKAAITLARASSRPSSRARSAAAGRPLPLELRRKAEELSGADLAEVRIHVVPGLERRGIRACTSGADIYFAPGEYEPDSEGGLWLLGHELAHVLQQREGRARNPHGYGVALLRDEDLERDADEWADRKSVV